MREGSLERTLEGKVAVVAGATVCCDKALTLLASSGVPGEVVAGYRHLETFLGEAVGAEARGRHMVLFQKYLLGD